MVATISAINYRKCRRFLRHPLLSTKSTPTFKQIRTLLVAGVAPTRGIDDKQSTLSRYWTMDRSLQRKLGKTNYQHIKRLCRDRGQLFEDTDFPPSNKAIYSHRKPALHPIVWMRPHVSQFQIDIYFMSGAMCRFYKSIKNIGGQFEN